MKEYQKRALRTFAQAFLGTLSTQIVVYQNQEFTKTIWISLVASALASGVSAIMNLNE
ncbi:MAG: hypothetical protein LIO71_05675 [Ruminococcus sp.]|nr:hypothetical protein [Ruminococcus sp.]